MRPRLTQLTNHFAHQTLGNLPKKNFKSVTKIPVRGKLLVPGKQLSSQSSASIPINSACILPLYLQQIVIQKILNASRNCGLSVIKIMDFQKELRKPSHTIPKCRTWNKNSKNFISIFFISSFSISSVLKITLQILDNYLP